MPLTLCGVWFVVWCRGDMDSAPSERVRQIEENIDKRLKPALERAIAKRYISDPLPPYSSDILLACQLPSTYFVDATNSIIRLKNLCIVCSCKCNSLC